MFKKTCIGFYPDYDKPEMCAHYYEEDGTCAFFHNGNDCKPYKCDDVIGDSVSAYNSV